MKYLRIIKHVISFALVVIVIVCFVYRYDKINTKYPTPQRVEYQMGEIVDYNDVKLLLKDFQILAINDVIDTYNLNKDDYVTASALEETVALARLRIQNDTNEKMKIQIYKLCLQSGAWSNEINYELYLSLNSGIGIELTLSSGEMLDIVLPFSAYNSQFNKNDWESFSSRKFELCLSSYTQKRVIII